MFAQLQVVEQVSKIYDMTVAQQKERQMKAEGLSNDMATSGSDGYLRSFLFAMQMCWVGLVKPDQNLNVWTMI